MASRRQPLRGGGSSRERVAALLDLPSASVSVMYLALLVMLLTGLALGWSGPWWGRGCIWLTLGLLFAESAAMWAMATRGRMLAH